MFCVHLFLIGGHVYYIFLDWYLWILTMILVKHSVYIFCTYNRSSWATKVKNTIIPLFAYSVHPYQSMHISHSTLTPYRISIITHLTYLFSLIHLPLSSSYSAYLNLSNSLLQRQIIMTYTLSSGQHPDQTITLTGCCYPCPESTAKNQSLIAVMVPCK